MTIIVRRATEADVNQMSAVLIASITELCAADHHNEPARIADWTRNKTPDGVREMLTNPDLSIFVAERDGAIAAVGGINGEIVALNYVAPVHRFSGVSKALLEALEAQLKARGHSTVRLLSSATAYRFYRRMGWIDAGQPGRDYSSSGRPMCKALWDRNPKRSDLTFRTNADVPTAVIPAEAGTHCSKGSAGTIHPVLTRWRNVGGRRAR